jgi:hypothetical protein
MYENVRNGTTVSSIVVGGQGMGANNTCFLKMGDNVPLCKMGGLTCNHK